MSVTKILELMPYLAEAAAKSLPTEKKNRVFPPSGSEEALLIGKEGKEEPPKKRTEKKT
jgi:hypothetical protein